MHKLELIDRLWNWLDAKPSLKVITMACAILGFPSTILGIVVCLIWSEPQIIYEGDTYVFPTAPVHGPQLQAIPKSETAPLPQPTVEATHTPLPDRPTATPSPTPTRRVTRPTQTASPQERTELTQRLNAGGDDHHFKILSFDAVHYREHGIAMLAAKSLSDTEERTSGLRYVALCAADADDSATARKAAELVVNSEAKAVILAEVNAVENGAELPFVCGYEST